MPPGDSSGSVDTVHHDWTEDPGSNGPTTWPETLKPLLQVVVELWQSPLDGRHPKPGLKEQGLSDRSSMQAVERHHQPAFL